MPDHLVEFVRAEVKEKRAILRDLKARAVILHRWPEIKRTDHSDDEVKNLEAEIAELELFLASVGDLET